MALKESSPVSELQGQACCKNCIETIVCETCGEIVYESPVNITYTNCLCMNCVNEANCSHSDQGSIECWNCCGDCTIQNMRQFECFTNKCTYYRAIDIALTKEYIAEQARASEKSALEAESKRKQFRLLQREGKLTI